MTVYLCGLYPNVMLYVAGVFFRYVLTISSVLLALIFASIPLRTLSPRARRSF